MKNSNVLKAIEALDLEPIKTKLMHASGEGWSRAKVEAMDVEYRRFLFLMHAFPHEESAPTVDVDTFWHYHILDTMKYAADCETVFGYFMHHYPYVGLDTAEEAGFEERGGARTRDLYEQTFGQPYIRAEAYGAAPAAADVQDAGSQAAYCMYRPDAQAVRMSDVQQAGSQAAYCMYRPDAPAGQANDVRQAGSQAAYCMYRPDAQQAAARADVQQAGAKAAYCMYRPDVAAQTDARPDVQQAGAKAAYCMYRPDQAQRPDVQQAGAKAAYCMYRPDAGAVSQARDVQQAGAKAAYCMYRPDAQLAGEQARGLTRDVQEAGAKAAYCMYRPDLKAADDSAAPCPPAPVAACPLAQAAAAEPVEGESMAQTGAAAAASGARRQIVVGATLADGVTPAYQVLAAGTSTAAIRAAAQRQPIRPADQAGARMAAWIAAPSAAMFSSTPIRPALELPGA